MIFSIKIFEQCDSLIIIILAIKKACKRKSIETHNQHKSSIYLCYRMHFKLKRFNHSGVRCCPNRRPIFLSILTGGSLPTPDCIIVP